MTVAIAVHDFLALAGTLSPRMLKHDADRRTRRALRAVALWIERVLNRLDAISESVAAQVKLQESDVDGIRLLRVFSVSAMLG